MRVLTLTLLLAGALVTGVAVAEPGPSAVEEHSHPFSHLEGRRSVDDTRLREMFDRAVTRVVAEQSRDLRDAAYVEVRRRRLQRRDPINPQGVPNVQPTHIPAIELVRIPIS